jgi:hypothetical protein
MALTTFNSIETTKVFVMSKLNVYIDDMFEKYHNTDFKIVSDAIAFCKKMVLEENKNRHGNGRTLTLADILDSTPYEWYYGNFISKLLVLLLFPYVLDDAYGRVAFEKRLSTTQINDLIWNMYDLITTSQCRHNVKDYYGFTPLQMVWGVYADALSDVPSDILDRFAELTYILRNGPGIVQKQQKFVKRWITKRRELRSKAVRSIEKWWLEVLFNPDTPVGQKKINTLSKHFYSLACDETS